MHKQLELLELSHCPMHGPRSDHFGEQTFASRWATIAPARTNCDWNDNATILDEVFSPYGYAVGQREATVAASLICWLGTNCGHAFLESARETRKRWPGEAGQTAFVAAWADENLRRPSINNGIRTLEYLLMSPDQMTHHTIPDLSAKDLESAECVVQWLATRRGEAFVRECETAVSALARNRRSTNRRALGA